MRTPSQAEEMESLNSDWLPIDEAVRLTGEPVRTTRWRAKVESDIARTKGRRSLAVKKSPPSGKGKPVWWVHRSIDKRLSLIPTAAERAERARDSLLCKGYAEHAVTLAYKRASWLRRWQDAKRRRNTTSATALELAESVVREARQVEGGGFGISVRTLQRWERVYGTLGSDGQIHAVSTR